MFLKLIFFLVLCACQGLTLTTKQFNELLTEDYDEIDELFHIEGVILPPHSKLEVNTDWLAEITISINGGEFKGFVQQDGNFVISGIPSGSYILDTQHPDIYIQPIRVEIGPNGKVRARKLSYIKPSHVIKLPYPLALKPLKRRKYFRSREQWNILDYVFNPMVLLMVVPLVLMLLLPRLINDPETKREIENIQFPQLPAGVPDFNDILTSFLAGKRLALKEQKEAAAAAAVPNKKR